jgi:hypothetical protein
MARVCGEPGAGEPGTSGPGARELSGRELSGRELSAREPGTGPAGAQDIGRRFRWLTAPRSTVVQAGPVHTGLTRDPDAEIDDLLRALVLRSR